MKTQHHTPGPWHIGANPGPIVYGPLGEQVANMIPCMLERDEHNANARLIAAAPELLAALSNIVATDQRIASTLPTELIEAARNAIARATL